MIGQFCGPHSIVQPAEFEGIPPRAPKYPQEEALVGGHSRDAKKVFVTEAGRLRECKNTEFVWELRERGFCEGGRK